MAGQDMIGQAQTGSGKTAAFGLPIVEHVDPSEREVQALVLTPTRELCIQVTQALRTYGARKGIDVVAVFGGAPIRTQQSQLHDGGQVVVGTVGRVLDLMGRGSLVLSSCRFVVLDEADEKADTLVNVLAAEKPDQAIVFTRTKVRADQLYRKLRDKGMNVKALHGDMSQGQRDGVMLSFKGGRVPILVATDVAARGLDISTVTHVVNFDVPISPDVYVHRIGRTGRVGRAGRAITFIEPRQGRELEAIERHIGTSVTPWSEGVKTAPAKVEEKPRRHSKPSISRDPDEPQVKLIAGVGKADGIEVADLVHAITGAAGVDGEAVRDVRVLERFSLVSVPRSEAERIVAAVDGTAVNGATVSISLARS